MSDLLPPNATAFERALAKACAFPPLEQPIKQLWSPYTCPASVLPWLAWALSVDEWNDTWPVETQRQVIAASIDQHRKKGTVGALRRALQRLGYEVEINERTGEAYTFRLRFKVNNGSSAGGSVIESAMAQATQIALRQKNARSYLAGTDFLADTDPVTIFVGGATCSGAEVEIAPAWTPMSLNTAPSWWLNASQLNLSDNSPITSFTDASGNGRHFTSSGTLRATYKTNVLNGLPVARFDGVNDVMICNAATSIRSIALVVKYSAATWQENYPGLITGNDDPVAVGGLAGQTGFNNFSAGAVFYKNNEAQNEEATGAGPMNQFAVLFITFPTGLNYIWQIGRDRNGTSRHWLGDYAEVIGSSAEWTTEERGLLFRYFQQKYDL